MKTFTELAEEVNQISIQSVIEDSAGCRFTGYGANLKCHSPLRSNGSLGSFNINTVRNCFHDWKLNVIGGPIKFYMIYFNIGFVDAVKELARRYNKGSFYGRPSAAIAPQILKVPEVKVNLNLDLIDKVYKIFLSLCNLNDEDFEYLLSRGLSKEEIDHYQFKTFPRRTLPFRKEFEELVEKEFGKTEILFDVPGFFRKKKEIFSFFYYSGIIIPVRNINGLIVGLQIRKKDCTENKYVWFSSVSCLESDPKYTYEKDGLGPGSPIGHIPSKEASKNLFVTEGFFKAIAIEKRYKSPVNTVQGVTNWKSMLADTNKILEKYPNLNRIMIAYDADMCYNTNVLVQASKLGNALKEKMNIRVDILLWNVEYGKGFDDLLEINSANERKIKALDIEIFSSLVKKIEEEVTEDMTKEQTKEIFDKYMSDYIN